MTIPHSERARQIADKLSPRMKQALVHPRAGGSSYAWTGLRTAEGLHARKLVGRVAGVGAFYSPQTAIKWPLTPLGETVRQILQESPPQ